MQNAERADRRRAIFDLLAVLGLVELQLWWLSELHAPLLSAVNIGLIFGLAWHSWRQSPVPCPLAAKPAPAWTAVGAATVFLAGLVFLLAWLCGYWPLEVTSAAAKKSALEWGLKKSGTALIQQLGLHLFLVPALYRAVRNWKGAVVLASVLFSLLHLPNPLLMLLTLTAGLCWCFLYFRTGRIAPLVCSHILLAVLAREMLFDGVYNMRVGARALPLLPFSIVAGDGTTLRVRPLTIIGNSAVRRHTATGKVVLGGWAADPLYDLPADKIVVLVAGQVLEFDSDHTPCPDMLTDHDLPHAINCGYQVEIPADLLVQDPHPRVFASRGTRRLSELEYEPQFARQVTKQVAQIHGALRNAAVQAAAGSTVTRR